MESATQEKVVCFPHLSLKGNGEFLRPAPLTQALPPEHAARPIKSERTVCTGSEQAGVTGGQTGYLDGLTLEANHNAIVRLRH